MRTPPLKGSSITASIHKPPSKDAARWRYDELLGMLGHDLRTPLNGAVGFLELLDSTELTAEQRDHLDTAMTCMRDLRVLLEGILECARMREGRLPINLQMVNLAEILRTLARQFALIVSKKGIRLELNLAPDIPGKLLLDEVKVRQITENLLNNAVKFTPDGGLITVRADAVEPPRNRTLSPGIFKIEIEDTGVGISEAELQKVFTPFFRGEGNDEVQKGAGLGLAIVERLVATLGGSITIKSSLGVGTMVTVVLPFPTDDSDIQLMRVPDSE